MARSAVSGRVLTSTRKLDKNTESSFVSTFGSSTKINILHNSGMPIFSQSGYSVVGRFQFTGQSSQGTLFSCASSASTNQLLFIAINSAGKLVVTLRNDANASQLSSVQSTAVLQTNRWYDFVWTDSNGAAKLYINGSQDATVFNYTPTGTYSFNTTTLGAIERLGGATQFHAGKLSEFRLYSRVLTSQEALAWHAGIEPSTANIKARWNLDEGSGSTANDTSGNGNNGTIVNGSFSRDAQFRSRQSINRNLLYNGTFEYAPSLVAPTITNGRWIDGTSTGSTTNSNFGWASPTGSSTSSSRWYFDSTEKYNGSNSMKIEALNSTGSATISTYDTTTASATMAVPCAPSTSYTMTAMLKTSNVPLNGAYIRLRTLNAAKGIVSTNISNTLSGTNDWTLCTVVFTTESNARYIVPLLSLNAGQVSSVWFDDVQLRKTSGQQRVAI